MKKTTITVTDEELFEICDALNSKASHYRNLADTRRVSKKSKDVWRTSADELNGLTQRLLKGREIEDLVD